MATCPYCDTELVEDFNFCVQCNKQTKCLNCGAYLIQDKTICLRCGTPTKAISTGATNLNTYTFEENVTETTSHKRVHLTATNEAIAAFLPRLPLGQESQSNFSGRATVVDSSPKGIEEMPALAEKQTLQQDKAIEANSHEVQIGTLFVDDNEHDIIPSRRLRTYLQTLASKAARQKAFTIFFVSAYNKQFSSGVTLERLIKATKNEGVYDTNYTRNLKGYAKDYLISTADGYGLQPYEGEQFIQEAIENIENPDHSPKPEAKQVSKRGRGKRTSITAEIKEIQPWLSENIEDLNKFDSRVLLTPLDWAIFGLYVLTKHLKVAEVVKPSSLYLYLSKKYPTMGHSRKNFIKAMGRARHLGKNTEGHLFLDSQSEERITQLVQDSMN